MFCADLIIVNDSLEDKVKNSYSKLSNRLTVLNA